MRRKIKKLTPIRARIVFRDIAIGYTEYSRFNVSLLGVSTKVYLKTFNKKDRKMIMRLARTAPVVIHEE